MTRRASSSAADWFALLVLFNPLAASMLWYAAARKQMKD